MNLNQRLKTIREHKGLRQNHVASNIGVSPSTLAGYESGFRTPDIDTLHKLAQFYDVSLDYLVGGKAKLAPGEPHELRTLLKEAALQLDGVPLTPLDKERINDVLTGLFWNHVNQTHDNPITDKSTK